MRTATDVLSALFLADAPADVLAAAAAVPRLSSGRVQHPETINRRTGRPERGGLFCARIFGPVDDHRCLCGKLASPTHAGETCDKCGVLCGDSRLRGERWGHVELPVPLVHPRLAAAIAAELDCTATDVLGVARLDLLLHPDGTVSKRSDHFEHLEPRETVDLATHLADTPHLLIKLVPVTPPAFRGTRRDPQDDAYFHLINRANRLARLIELNAPQIILDNEQRMAQLALERLIDVVRAELRARRPVTVIAPDTARARALLQAVYDDPASDPARRAYAAHLTAAGDLRGEFITSQVARAATRMTKQEADQLRRNLDLWIAPLAGAITDSVAFRRGFPAVCRTLPAAAQHLDNPAWSTVEHLDTDLADLIAAPTTRALTSIVTPYKTIHDLCHRDDLELPNIHRATIQLPRTPPPDHPRFTAATTFPGLRDLTLIQRSARAVDYTWLDDTPLARQLDKLTIHLPLEHTAALPIKWWIGLLTRHPQLPALTLHLGKNRLRFDLRHDGRWTTLRVTVSPGIVEQIAMGNTELAETLATTLTTLTPEDVITLRIDSGRYRWFGEDLERLATTLRTHFGPTITLPRLA